MVLLKAKSETNFPSSSRTSDERSVGVADQVAAAFFHPVSTNKHISGVGRTSWLEEKKKNVTPDPDQPWKESLVMWILQGSQFLSNLPGTLCSVDSFANGNGWLNRLCNQVSHPMWVGFTPRIWRRRSFGLHSSQVTSSSAGQPYFCSNKRHSSFRHWVSQNSAVRIQFQKTKPKIQIFNIFWNCDIWLTMSTEDDKQSGDGNAEKMAAKYNLFRHKSKDISSLNYNCENFLINLIS